VSTSQLLFHVLVRGLRLHFTHFFKKNTFDFFVAQPNDTARGC
jgi:hypothetical protein